MNSDEKTKKRRHGGIQMVVDKFKQSVKLEKSSKKFALKNVELVKGQ
jgi:hypothetical protein